MGIRKIPKNYRNVTGIAAHAKSSEQAMFESTLERDFLTLLEFSEEVVKFDVQPIRLEWLNEQEQVRTYTPDVLAHYNNKPPVLVEVKYRSDLKKDWQRLKPKFIKAIRYAKQQRWKFKIITEVEIRNQLLDTAKFLIPFIRRGASEESHMQLLVDKIQELGRATPTQLAQAIFNDEWNQAALLPTLWYLIGTRQIGIDLNSKITMNSEIWSIGRHG
jgi:ferritin